MGRFLTVASSPNVVTAIVNTSFLRIDSKTDRLASLRIGAVRAERLLGVLLRSQELSCFCLGIPFSNLPVMVRTSQSTNSLVEGSGVSREIAFTLVSATLLVDGAPRSVSMEKFNSKARAGASSGEPFWISKVPSNCRITQIFDEVGQYNLF